ncbi:ammonia-forming cytochrome c nitrite reductase subunit c552 [Geoglobus acetivorans]|uniref:Ammonia-forming cytochrome c nitrite reductase subunit c552 n=1 Tax=Geoglobus acetivorans TaxID=565033 RepID=A0ABZ3H5N3_GEOAI
MRGRYLVILLVVLAVVFAGCSQQEEKTAPTPTPTPEKTPTPVPTPDIEKIKQKAVEDAVHELMVSALNLHYDNPNTPEVEGVNVNPEFGCSGCHFSKEAVPRMEEWGRSAHGGHVLEVKEEDVTKAVTEEDAPAWVHYDFKQPNRQPCQKCHTSTGFRNFVSDPENYNPENNTFLLTGQQKEFLYCWACHKVEDGSFELRNPGRFARVAEYSEPADRISAVPDLGESNLCMVCHSGRSSGAAIKSAEEIKGKHFGAFNSHYLAAGGIIFRTLPYEFEGRDYVSSNPHASIEGLCTACHMSNADHTFEAVEVKNGAVVDIKAYDTLCKKCHGDDKNALISTINERKSQYESALKTIEKLLAEKGIYYDGERYPYFYGTPNAEEHTFANAFKDWPSKDILGAAYNLNLLAREPGAFVHNPEYVKQIIYDTIDFLDDGVLNKSAEKSVPEDVKAFIQGAR